MRFLSYAIVTACLSILLAGMVFVTNLENVLSLWGQDIQINAYFQNTTTEVQKQQIEESILKINKIEKVSYISQEQALADFKSQLVHLAPSFADDEDILAILPSSLQIKIKEEAYSNIGDIANQIQNMIGIEDVSYGQDWVKNYTQFVNGSRIIVFSTSIIMIFVVVFLISNVIKVLVDQKKDEVEILEMIGADYFMIRKPFVMQGFYLGIISAALAAAFIYLLFYIIKIELTQQFQFQWMSFLNVTYVLFFLTMSGVMGAIGAFISVRRLNSGWATLENI